jgi:hypothetical protein
MFCMSRRMLALADPVIPISFAPRTAWESLHEPAETQSVAEGAPPDEGGE